MMNVSVEILRAYFAWKLQGLVAGPPGMWDQVKLALPEAATCMVAWVV